jgi:hypothetical protein
VAETFDRWSRLLAAGDLDGLLGLYHEDALVLRFDRTVRGREALREHLAALLAQRPQVLETLQLAAAEDVVAFQAVIELGGEPVRMHGTFLLRGERILREATGLFPQASGAPRGRAQVSVDLEPYTPWPARPVPDPREAGREAIGPVLLEIVDAEGPLHADRAYRLYVRASGGKALTTIARAPLSGAAHRLRNAGAVVLEPDGEGVDVLRMAGSAEVRVRELGPRALDEVPMAELAELARRLASAGATDLPRAVLDAYGLVRMTAKAEQLLGRAVELARQPRGA